MGHKKLQPWSTAVWDLVDRQYGVVSRRQLLSLGLTTDAVSHRLEHGRLHRLWRGVYAVGRPEVGQRGMWMAAVLACGPESLLGCRSAAELWGLLDQRPRCQIEVVVPNHVIRRQPGIRIRRHAVLGAEDRFVRKRIPVTGLIATLIDVAATEPQLVEMAVGAADRQGLIDPETLRASLGSRSRWPGTARLASLLDRHTFTRTDSVLERWFLKIADDAGLPRPATQVEMNGFRVDFYWAEAGLVVETNGLHYHRTPAQQAKDLRRDQAHTAVGLRTLRFSAAQVRYEAEATRTSLRATFNAGRRDREASSGSGDPKSFSD